MIDEIKNETLKLNSLIDSLIKLSDIDSIKQTENVILKPLIQEILHNFQSQIQAKNITLNLEIPENISLKAHKNYLSILLSNLI